MRQLSLEEITSACRDEAGRPREAEAGYCFELFRRALESRQEAAWTAIQQQYRQLILSWAYTRAPANLDPDEAEQIAQEGLIKFWRTLSVRPGHLADQFPHVGALLKYLHQCIVTAILDRRRRQQRLARLQERLHTIGVAHMNAPDPEAQALAGLEQAERLDRVRAWIHSTITDPHEQQVLRLSFEQDLSPAQIAARHPDRFPDPDTVRRIKERLLKRARRNLVNSIGKPPPATLSEQKDDSND